MKPTLTQLASNPTSEPPAHLALKLPRGPTLPSLSPEDRTKLSTLFRARGDAVSFAHLREEDPLETLVWLDQPHIKPWHEAIKAAHRDHEQTETHLSLARALRDITRILDLEADSKLRIRAVNAIIKLANAIHRSRATDHSSGRSVSSAVPNTCSRPTAAAKSTAPSTSPMPKPPSETEPGPPRRP